MRGNKLYVIALALVVLSSMACAPKSTPAPAPQSAPPKAGPAARAPGGPVISPEEAAWNQIVDEAKKEGEVTLYTFSFTGDIGKAVAQAFEAEYGIKVGFVTGVGATLVERIKSEQAASKYFADTVDTSIVQVLMLKQDSMTQSRGTVPALREKGAWIADPSGDVEGHVVAMRSTILTPYINTQLVEPKDTPRSLQDMLSPKWKRQIAMGNPLTVPVTVWVYLLYKRDGILQDEYWRRIGQQEPRYGNSVRDLATFLARGEVASVFYTSDTAMAPLVKEGAPIKAIEFDVGTVLVPQASGIAMVRNAPHPNAARVFINWILTQKGQTVFSQAMGGMLSLRKDVADLRPAALRTEQKKMLMVDLAMQHETFKVQKEMTVNKLLGIEK